MAVKRVFFANNADLALAFVAGLTALDPDLQVLSLIQDGGTVKIEVLDDADDAESYLPVSDRVSKLMQRCTVARKTPVPTASAVASKPTPMPAPAPAAPATRQRIA